MSEDQIKDVEQEVVTSQAEETGEQEQQKAEPSHGSPEYNFREMRKLLEEQQRRIRELEHVAMQRTQPAQEEQEDEIAGDDFVTADQVERLATKKAEELIRKQNAETLEDRTRLKFKDYDDVVTEENVKKLIEDDTDLADSIRKASNPYATAYKLIKKSAFFGDFSKAKARGIEAADKIAKNAQKPLSSNAVQSRPLAQAQNYMNLSEQERQSLYKEMMDYAARRS